MTARGIIVLEGADASGKTTLARHFVEKHGARYIHLGPHRDIWKWHIAALRRAARLADDGLVILDRHWISELAYGRVYREGGLYPIAARCLDRVLLKHAAVYVLCAPRDQARQIARFDEIKETRREYASDVSAVVKLYADLRDGNAGATGDDYLSQLIRAGEFTRRADVMTYDVDRSGGSLHEVAAGILEHLRVWRAYQYAPALSSMNQNVLGHRGAARVLIVGGYDISSRFSPTIGWPFCHREGNNDITFFNRALSIIEFNETEAMWTCAPNVDRHLEDLLNDGLPALCVGKRAIDAVRKTNPDARHRFVSHPSEVRFSHDDINEYAARIGTAIKELIR